jgi:hypothetical protein
MGHFRGACGVGNGVWEGLASLGGLLGWSLPEA